MSCLFDCTWNRHKKAEGRTHKNWRRVQPRNSVQIAIDSSSQFPKCDRPPSNGRLCRQRIRAESENMINIIRSLKHRVILCKHTLSMKTAAFCLPSRSIDCFPLRDRPNPAAVFSLTGIRNSRIWSSASKPKVSSVTSADLNVVGCSMKDSSAVLDIWSFMVSPTE